MEENGAPLSPSLKRRRTAGKRSFVYALNKDFFKAGGLRVACRADRAEIFVNLL